MSLRKINIVAKPKPKFGMKNMAGRGSNYWNMLPLGLKKSESLEILKAKLKNVHWI